MIDLGRSAPDHGEAADTFFFLKLADVVHDPLGVIHLAPAGHHVGAVEAFDEILFENRFHRLNRLQGRFDLFQQRHLQHACFDGGFVGVVLENIPAAYFQIVDSGQRHEILDCGATAFRALSQANSTKLGQRPDRLCQSPFDCFQPGDERGRHRAHTGDQNPQLALGGRDLDVVLIGQNAVSFGRNAIIPTPCGNVRQPLFLQS